MNTNMLTVIIRIISFFVWFLESFRLVLPMKNKQRYHSNKKKRQEVEEKRSSFNTFA